MSRKAARVGVTITFRTAKSKMRMVKAKLPEPQTWVLKWEAAHLMVDVPFGVGG